MKVSIPFREELHSDIREDSRNGRQILLGFHPFQGRAPFGQIQAALRPEKECGSFHPFQGRAPFGLFAWRDFLQVLKAVSIPFREELHSDQIIQEVLNLLERVMFPSLSGKSSIRTLPGRPLSRSGILQRFHPFQGRAPFGQRNKKPALTAGKKKFPSLSGKSSIRTRSLDRNRELDRNTVSIPFREELHSDSSFSIRTACQDNSCFHPFQGRAPFGRMLSAVKDFIEILSFHPFQGRAPFGLVQEFLQTMQDPIVSIPFREELHSDS